MGNDELMLSYINSFNNALVNNANVLMAAQTSRQDRAFSREMSDLAWQRNLEAWNMQNEYNLPTNVYRRQLEGIYANGLNPNLVYGNSSSVTGSAGAPSPYKFEGYHSTAVPHFGSGSFLDSLLSTRLMQTQLAAQEANNRLINARADNEEARNPGISARSNEAAYRWQTIEDNYLSNYDDAIRANIAKEYWTGVKSQLDAEYADDKRRMSNVEAMMAEWLQETEAPGTGMTYRQYMEACKAFLPGIQFEKMKADVLYVAARMKYLAEQKNFLQLREEYQGYVNRLARYGRSLGNDWVTLLLSGISNIFGLNPEDVLGGIITGTGQTQTSMPPTYPGP